MKNQHSIQTLCASLSVSASGYYDWRSRLTAPGFRARETQELTRKIKAIHATSRQTYGSPRILAQLRKAGLRHGRNRIARIMLREGLCGRQKARYRVQTTDSNHDEPIAPNRLADAPAPSGPNQIWVADITYIDAGPDSWLYLAAILDLYSRKIVGWAMGERIDTALILKALSMALLHRHPPRQPALPLRSRCSVRLSRLPARPGSGRHHRLHEPQRQLLRQCRHGKLLEHPQT